MALQQRLNSLGHTDYDDQPLLVDGRLGPRTEQAIRKLKASAATPPGQPARQTPEVDSLALRLLNAAPGAVSLNASDRRALADALRSSGSELGELATAASLTHPLPLVGSTEPVDAPAVSERDGDDDAEAPSPLVSISSVLGLDQRLTVGLFGPLADYFETTETVSPESLQAFLAARGITEIGELTTHVNDPAYPNQFRFDVTYETQATESRTLNLGRAAAEEGV